MDPPTMMHEGAFSGGNAASFNLSEIWQFPGGEAAGGLGVRRGQFGQNLSQFMNATNQEVSGDDPMSSVVEQHGGGAGGRKRRDLDDESAKVVSTSSGNGVSDYEGKRPKNLGCKEENGESRGEAELSSGKTVEQNTQPPKQDYIHVRARRGQATDSHSLAERARREKISERMKILQDLVPGCNKVIGKALVLDEIINYIQSLQRQVEFLSMKLEAVNSRMTPNIEVFPPKEFTQQAFDTDGVAYGSQTSREYVRGSSPEWLHMQVGGGFERTT